MRAIALQTWRMYARQGGLLTMVLLSCLSGLFIVFGASISLGEAQTMVIVLGFSIVEIVGLLTILSLGSYIIFSEKESGMMQIVLTKTPYLYTYTFGKFFGLAAIVLSSYIAISVVIGILFLLYNISFDRIYIRAIVMSCSKILILTAALILGGLFIRQFILVVAMLTLYIVSHSAPAIYYHFTIVDTSSKIVGYISTTLYYLLPPFADMSISEYVFSPTSNMYTGSHIALLMVNVFLYIISFLLLATFLYRYFALSRS